MLNVQKWLMQDSKNPLVALNNLKDQLGIKYTLHDDGRVILNYNQLESPKTNPIVRECRGLTLQMESWDLVARSFYRFFNLGEHRDEQDDFDWSKCWATDKHDGSLFILYYWQGQWHMNTRGSFGDGQVGDTPMTWHKLAELALPENWRKKLDPQFTYVGELCSAYNRIVTYYPEPQFFCLAMFDGEYELDASLDLANDVGLAIPNYYSFDNANSVIEYVNERAKEDATYEGLVLCDDDIRIKVKSASYVALHRMASNGALLSPKNMLRVILEGEVDEILIYYPELKSHFDKMQNKLDEAYQQVDNLWYCYHDEKNQKKFALAVKNSPFSSVLFTARKTGRHPREVWNESQDLILKKMFK